MNDGFWFGFLLLPLGVVALGVAIAILAGIFWACQSSLEGKLWREQGGLAHVLDLVGASNRIHDVTLHLLAPKAWHLSIAPGVRITLWVAKSKPTKQQYREVYDALISADSKLDVD